MPKTEHENVIMDYPAMPPIDDGARMRLKAIIAFFDTKCENCKENYCEDCTARMAELIYEARDYLAEIEHGA